MNEIHFLTQLLLTVYPLNSGLFALDLLNLPIGEILLLTIRRI